jgi:hypothetical protein
LCPIPSMKSFSLPSITILPTRNNFSQMRADHSSAKYISSSSVRDLPSNGHRYSATPSSTVTTSYDTSPYSDHYLSDFPRILTRYHFYPLKYPDDHIFTLTNNISFLLSSSPSNAQDGDELLNKLEISGKVPSKDKFRRMACMVGMTFYLVPRNKE